VVVNDFDAVDVQNNVFVAHGLCLFLTLGFKPNETAARKGFIWQLPVAKTTEQLQAAACAAACS
jgi:hypothetical protein